MVEKIVSHVAKYKDELNDTKIHKSGSGSAWLGWGHNHFHYIKNNSKIHKIVEVVRLDLVEGTTIFTSQVYPCTYQVHGCTLTIDKGPPKTAFSLKMLVTL
jgi:hypothetical protein